MSKFLNYLDRDLLEQLAWGQSFERGVKYFETGAVRSLRATGDRIIAKVTGTRCYQVRLCAKQGNVEFDCSCPVGRDGLFCKHCVAVGLAWRDGGEKADDAASDDFGEADLRAFLLGLEKDDLVTMIIDRAHDDERFHRQLMTQAARSTRAKSDLPFWRGAIDDAVRTGEFVDYWDMHDYSSGIDEVLDGVEGLLTCGRAEAVIELTEYGLDAVETALDHSDDSDGWIGGLLERLQGLHLAACEKVRPDAVELAERLFEAELESGYGVFHGALETYRDVLGKPGLNAFRKLAEAEWARIEPLGPGDKESRYDGNRFSITSIMETLAKTSGDIELLVAIKSKNLSMPYGFLEIARVYEAAGQSDRALEWAEKGRSAFPGERLDERLRNFIADAYHERGRHDEAMALVWKAFADHPYLNMYQALQDHARRAGEWDSWHNKALSLIRALIWEEMDAVKAPPPGQRAWRAPTRYDGSTLVRVFLYEQDVAAAWREAKEHDCSDDLWLELARRREGSHPAGSIKIYREHIDGLLRHTGNHIYEGAVEFLQRIHRLMIKSGEEADFESLVKGLRDAQKRKRNLIKLFDAKGW